MPALGGYWLSPRRMASTATSFNSSGPSVSGKPWPRLTEPVARASSDMVAKMVVVKGRSRRASCVSPCPTATIVPVASGAAYRRAWTVLSIANFNMHCGMDGWGRPYDYLGAITSFGTDVIVLQEAWTNDGRGHGTGGGGGGRAVASPPSPTC